MLTYEEINNYVFPKYQPLLERLTSPFRDLLGIVEMSFTRTFCDSSVIDIVLKKAEKIDWYQQVKLYNSEPLWSHQKVISMPSLYTDDVVQRSMVDDRLDSTTLYYSSIGNDFSVSRLTMIFESHLEMQINMHRVKEFSKFLKYLEVSLVNEMIPIDDFMMIGRESTPSDLLLSQIKRPILDILSRREIDVIMSIISGSYSAKQMAHDLSISPRTCEDYIANICCKLDLPNKDSLVLFSLRHRYQIMQYMHLCNLVEAS